MHTSHPFASPTAICELPHAFQDGHSDSAGQPKQPLDEQAVCRRAVAAAACHCDGLARHPQRVRAGAKVRPRSSHASPPSKEQLRIARCHDGEQQLPAPARAHAAMQPRAPRGHHAQRGHVVTVGWTAPTGARSEPSGGTPRDAEDERERISKI